MGRHLADLLGEPDAAERAELILSLIAGVLLMRTVIGTTALSQADPAVLAGQLQSMTQPVIDQD